MIFQFFQSLTLLQVAFKLLKEPSAVLKLNKGVCFFIWMNTVDECTVKFTCSDECFLFPRWGNGVLFKDSVLKGPGVTNDTGCNSMKPLQFRSIDILYITLFYELGIALLEYLCQWTILIKKNNLWK